MRDEAFAQTLRLFCRRQPFRPFFIQLVTGERLLVVHPEAVQRRENFVVFVSPLKQYHLFDSSSVCRVLEPGRD